MKKPDVNAFIDGNDLVYHDYADISIAISTPTGLVVPPVKNVESLSFAEIEQEIKRLATCAMQWRTYTGGNGGRHLCHYQWWGVWFLAQYAHSEYAQLGYFGYARHLQSPTAINGHMEEGPMMYLALSLRPPRY
ncbi:MAG: 2-oxo acid dehydrogenase subunit E2 [Saprospiraceae bacterium]